MELRKKFRVTIEEYYNKNIIIEAEENEVLTKLEDEE